MYGSWHQNLHGSGAALQEQELGLSEITFRLP